MVPAGNKAKRLSSVNHTTKTIHHHHKNYSSVLVVKTFEKHLRAISSFGKNWTKIGLLQKFFSRV